MPDDSAAPRREATFEQALDNARKRVGRDVLSDTDLLVLLCGELARTYTRDEKGYK